MRIKRFLFIVISVLLTHLISCTEDKTNTSKRNRKLNTHICHADTSLLNLVQKQTINYFWEGAEPSSGMARERLHLDNLYPVHEKNIVTTGGTGFGLMAILVGIERGFIDREEGLERFEQIVTFLEQADRFHGVWPHWLVGKTGKVYPFSEKDNGGDLVETAFLVQGLLAVKEYFKNGNNREKKLAANIQSLWEEIEWNWHTKGGENVLYWHWSPNYNWEMDFPVGGYNEALIMYVLAAASPTHPIAKEVYEKGWALNGKITKDTLYYGYKTILNHYEHGNSPVGPLFWAHYSFLGLNPNGLQDQYADYWKLNTNHTLIHYTHSLKNPNQHKGYGKNMWGLTSSYSIKGYSSHRPDRDTSIISPTAAISSIPYTPKESLKFISHLYAEHDSLIGKYGPYDAFSFEKKWYLTRYLAINQGTIPVMIENHRTGLIWNLFMQNEDVQNGLKKLGFTSPYIN